MKLDRSVLLRLSACLATAVLGAGLTDRTSAAVDHPLASFDQEMEQYMRARSVPGGALAVVKEGKLLYARGYGWADREKKQPAEADSLFRIASISKPITAVAVLQLVEQGKLKLEDRAFDLVRLPAVVPEGKKADPRLASITIRQLLEHSGGWDRDKSYDAMFRPELIANAVGVPPPAGPEAVIRYMLGQPLDFDPGTQYAYSNLGYCILGRVIEKASGRTYEEYVRRHVLAPAGVTAMRIGATLEKGRLPKEVRYYSPTDRRGRSVFPSMPGDVPVCYGTFNLEAMDAHGAWVASAVDLAKFAAALDDPEHSPLLKPASFREMYARPAPPLGLKEDGSPADVFYGLGWQVRPVGNAGKANYWHGGSLPGTWTLLVRRWDGLTWAALFNQRSEDRKTPDGEIDPALHRAAAAVKQWPTENLFGRYR
ncbi:MAG: serine hydrolase domain-containing protein [Actinomycetota bacterium]